MKKYISHCWAITAGFFLRVTFAEIIRIPGFPISISRLSWQTRVQTRTFNETLIPIWQNMQLVWYNLWILFIPIRNPPSTTKEFVHRVLMSYWIIILTSSEYLHYIMCLWTVLFLFCTCNIVFDKRGQGWNGEWDWSPKVDRKANRRRKLVKKGGHYKKVLKHPLPQYFIGLTVISKIIYTLQSMSLELYWADHWASRADVVSP